MVSATDSSAGTADQSRDFERRIFAGAGLMIGLVTLLAVAFAAAIGDDVGDLVSLVGVAVAFASAASVVGALLGFLFGIPRTLQHETATEGGPQYLANTNLEQISDWLTKILVGISLVQIGNIGPALAGFAEAIGPMLGDEEASPGFGLALCIFATVSSFLLAYLWTRVRLKHELQLADRDIEAAVRMVVDERGAADARALSLLDRQLSGQNEPGLEQLSEAFSATSESALVLIFQRAEEARARFWRDPDKQAEHDRTIPVFRALIANDPDHRYHRHFGSLGFALKDSHPPDLQGAIDALSTAIEIRGDPSDFGFVFYEWNRAAARIMNSTAAGILPDLQAQIEADLRVAAKYLQERYFTPTGGTDPTIDAVAGWMAANGLAYQALRA